MIYCIREWVTYFKHSLLKFVINCVVVIELIIINFLLLKIYDASTVVF